MITIGLRAATSVSAAYLLEILATLCRVKRVFAVRAWPIDDPGRGPYNHPRARETAFRRASFAAPLSFLVVDETDQR
jgi:hypothetical protein